MKKSFLLLSAGLLIAATIFQGCKEGKGTGAGDAVTLKMNLPVGAQYSYVMDTKTNMNMQGMIRTDQAMLMESTYNVQAGEGSDKKIAISYDRISMSMTSPMGNMEYDSKTGKDTSGNPFGMMLNKPFTMTVTENGEIKKIEGLSEIVNGIGNANDPETAAARKQLEESFSDTAMRNIMEQSFNFYPNKAVKTGDTWQKQMTVAIGPVAMKIDNTYKLASISGGTAHLDVTSKITSNGGSMSAGGQDVKMDINGDAKGTMDVDVATGFLKASTMKQNITGSMAAAGMSMPLTMAIDIQMTGKKK